MIKKTFKQENGQDVKLLTSEIFDEGGKTLIEILDSTDNKIFNSTGYLKLPNGLILQWGNIYIAGLTIQQYSQSQNFPIAFPNACVNIQLTISDVGYGDSYFTTGIGLTGKNNLNFMFTIKCNDTVSKDLNVDWFAIGY